MLFDIADATTPIHYSLHPSAFVTQYDQTPPSPFVVFGSKNRGALRAELESALELVKEFQSMPANWDGYGALVINGDTARNARTALSRLLVLVPAPEITPNPNGTVSFEWETHYGLAHLEIGMTRFSLYIKSEASHTIHLDGRADQIDSDLGYRIAARLYPSLNNAETITKLCFTADHARTAA